MKEEEVKRTYTVFCKMPGDGPGEYSEEIDITTEHRSETSVKREAQKIIDEMYDPELRPVRVVARFGTFL